MNYEMQEQFRMLRAQEQNVRGADSKKLKAFLNDLRLKLAQDLENAMNDEMTNEKEIKHLQELLKGSSARFDELLCMVLVALAAGNGILVNYILIDKSFVMNQSTNEVIAIFTLASILALIICFLATDERCVPDKN